MSPKRRTWCFVTQSVLVATVVCLGLADTATAQTSPGTAVPGYPFEIHGRLLSGSAPAPFALGDSWAQGSKYVGVLDDNGNPTNDPATGWRFNAKLQVDQNWGNQGDGYDLSAFAGGNKNFQLIGPSDEPWEWGDGGGPQKNDLTNAYLHTRVDPVTGDRWVFVAAESRSINGDSNVDFEFNQAGVVQLGAEGGQLIGLGPDGGRTVNDFIISIDFVDGGETPVASVRVWDGSSYELLGLPDTAYSATNFEDIYHPTNGMWKHFTDDGAPTDVLTHLQLVEGGVNLSALGIDVSPCGTDATFLVKTRSSSSFTSDLKDFTLVHFPIEPPAQAEIVAPELVCPHETFDVSAIEITGLPDPSFSWEISGCGTIVSDPGAAVVTVQAGPECDCAITLTVTVVAGECEEPSVASTTVPVRDDTPPTLMDVPADETAECDAIPEPPVVTAAGDCSEPVVEFSETIESGACDSGYTLIRTWTATDECGNQSSQSQVITVVDTTAPMLSGVPVDDTVECDAIPEPPLVTASDNCSDPLVELSESVEPGPCAGQYAITRTWTATDACGNQASQSQIITVIDTTAPVLSGVPADETAECDAVPYPPQVTASDNCSEPTVELSESIEPGASVGQYMLTRTWTATDACGNQSSQSQLITVVDTTAPVLDGVPADETVECDAIPDPPPVSASDSCSNPVVELSESMEPGACAGQYTLTRTWTATDEAGNQSSLSQVITVVDTTAPVLIDVPADETVECDAIPGPAPVTASDNCSDAAIEFSEHVEPGMCLGQSTITRTWTATDDCGNQSSQSQVITVIDTTAPVLSGVPADETVECDAIPEPSPVTASDNCSDALVELSESVTPGSCAAESTITRTWTATDDCGNQSSETQVITVVDTTAPALSNDPADFTAECDSVPGPVTLTATDNCDPDVPVEFSEETVYGDCAGRYTLLRSWTAVDDCGNSASVSQTVTVQDTTPPEISLDPETNDVFICDGPAVVLIAAADNCGSVEAMSCNITVDFPERVILEQLEPGLFRLTLTGDVVVDVEISATDDCGNVSDAGFTLTAQCGSQACSAGYWRNNIDDWCLAGYNPLENFCFAGPATLFVDAFGITDFSSSEIPASFDPGLTLLQALNTSGGAFNQTLFQGSAALMNAAHPDVDSPTIAARVKRVMQDAFAGVISFNEARSIIYEYNAAERECGCPFSGGIPTSYDCQGDTNLCPADLNGDGYVGLSDLSVLLGNYGLSNAALPEEGDLNGDEVVDITDLAELVGVYGMTCP